MLQHVPSKCKAGSQECSRDLAHTRLDLRNGATNWQVEGTEVLPGDPYHAGLNTEREIFSIYSQCQILERN